MKLIYSLILLIAFTGLNSQAQTKDEYLNQIIEKAIAESPELKSLEIQKRIAKERINIGTALPDPVLTLGLANMPVNSFSFTQEPMTGKVIGISQAIPFPGKLGTLADAKATDTLIVAEQIADTKNYIVSEVTSLYYQILLTDKKIELAEKRKELLQQIEEVTSEKYRVGKASLQNLVQTGVEISKIEDLLATLKNKRAGLLEKLQVRLHSEAIIPTSEKIELPEILSKINANEVETLVQNNPQLKSILLNVEKSEKIKQVRKYGFYPNFKLSLQYNQRDYSAASGNDWVDFLSAVVGITLPLDYGGNKSAEINEAEGMKNLYAEKYNVVTEKIKSQTSLLIAKLNELAERNDIIKNQLLPKAEKALSSAKADYNTGKIDFSNVLGSENQLLKIETEYYETVFGYLKTLAQLQYLLGSNDIHKIFVTE